VKALGQDAGIPALRPGIQKLIEPAHVPEDSKGSSRDLRLVGPRRAFPQDANEGLDRFDVAELGQSICRFFADAPAAAEERTSVDPTGGARVELSAVAGFWSTLLRKKPRQDLFLGDMLFVEAVDKLS
jgi:hypothetical protein